MGRGAGERGPGGRRGGRRRRRGARGGRRGRRLLGAALGLPPPLRAPRRLGDADSRPGEAGSPQAVEAAVRGRGRRVGQGEEEEEGGGEGAEEEAAAGAEAAGAGAGAGDGEEAQPPLFKDGPPKQQEARYALPPGLSLRRVDVGGRGGANKPAVLLALLRRLAARGQRSVVFCASVAGAEAVARFLGSVEPPLRLSRDPGEGEEEGEGGREGEGDERDDTGEEGASAGLLAAGGAATPAERQAALRRFAAFSLPALVCSDGATRGLDLGAGGRTAVISYDPPAHAKALVHRAGRAVRGEGGARGGGGGGAEGQREAGGGGGGDDGKRKKSSTPAAVGTAYTLLRPQDAAFHKELLRKVAGEGAAAAIPGVAAGEAGAEQQQPFAPAAARQLLKALKLPKAALREARKEAEAAVEKLSAAAAAAPGGGKGGAGRGL